MREIDIKYPPNGPNLRISGLKTEDSNDFKERLEGVLPLLSGNCSYYGHTLSGQRGSCVALVTIAFSNHDVDAKIFLRMLFHAESAPLLDGVSTSGLLGFSAVEGGDLERPWKSAVLGLLSAEGLGRIVQLGRAGRGKNCEWLDLASFLASSCISAVPDLAPVLLSSQMEYFSGFLYNEAEAKVR